ncbi:MAG: hypothetical protein GEV11_11040, partial [Streptosporangiales bacterium]|nr:hypothetical protein [Streptosporangiales bacterium]
MKSAPGRGGATCASGTLFVGPGGGLEVCIGRDAQGRRAIAFTTRAGVGRGGSIVLTQLKAFPQAGKGVQGAGALDLRQVSPGVSLDLACDRTYQDCEAISGPQILGRPGDRPFGWTGAGSSRPGLDGEGETPVVNGPTYLTPGPYSTFNYSATCVLTLEPTVSAEGPCLPDTFPVPGRQPPSSPPGGAHTPVRPDPVVPPHTLAFGRKIEPDEDALEPFPPQAPAPSRQQPGSPRQNPPLSRPEDPPAGPDLGRPTTPRWIPREEPAPPRTSPRGPSAQPAPRPEMPPGGVPFEVPGSGSGSGVSPGGVPSDVPGSGSGSEVSPDGVPYEVPGSGSDPGVLPDGELTEVPGANQGPAVAPDGEPLVPPPLVPPRVVRPPGGTSPRPVPVPVPVPAPEPAVPRPPAPGSGSAAPEVPARPGNGAPQGTVLAPPR